jgi:hypothetical protein
MKSEIGEKVSFEILMELWVLYFEQWMDVEKTKLTFLIGLEGEHDNICRDQFKRGSVTGLKLTGDCIDLKNNEKTDYSNYFGSLSCFLDDTPEINRNNRKLRFSHFVECILNGSIDLDLSNPSSDQPKNAVDSINDSLYKDFVKDVAKKMKSDPRVQEIVKELRSPEKAPGGGSQSIEAEDDDADERSARKKAAKNIDYWKYFSETAKATLIGSSASHDAAEAVELYRYLLQHGAIQNVSLKPNSVKDILLEHEQTTIDAITPIVATAKVKQMKALKQSAVAKKAAEAKLKEQRRNDGEADSTDSDDDDDDEEDEATKRSMAEQSLGLDRKKSPMRQTRSAAAASTGQTPGTTSTASAPAQPRTDSATDDNPVMATAASQSTPNNAPDDIDQVGVEGSVNTQNPTGSGGTQETESGGNMGDGSCRLATTKARKRSATAEPSVRRRSKRLRKSDNDDEDEQGEDHKEEENDDDDTVEEEEDEDDDDNEDEEEEEDEDNGDDVDEERRKDDEDEGSNDGKTGEGDRSNANSGSDGNDKDQGNEDDPEADEKADDSPLQADDSVPQDVIGLNTTGTGFRASDDVPVVSQECSFDGEDDFASEDNKVQLENYFKSFLADAESILPFGKVEDGSLASSTDVEEDTDAFVDCF